MNEKKERKKTGLMLGVSAAVLAAAVLALLLPAQGSAPGMDGRQASAEQTVLSEESELYQTLFYNRCGHTVTRRMTAPVETYGKNLQEVEALYPDWQVTEFSPALVKMERQPDLFCPDHRVVMPDGAGYLCVYENKYGEAMSLVRELHIRLSDLPAAVQEECRHGVGFATAQEMEMWLEGVES